MLQKYNEKTELANPIIITSSPRGTITAYNTSNIDIYQQDFLLEKTNTNKNKCCQCCVVN